MAWLDQRVVCACLLLGLGGCASTGSGEGGMEPADQQASQQAAQQAPAEPRMVAGINVEELAKKIRDSRLSHYHVSDDSYSLYVGGKFFAKYYPGDNKLTVRGDSSSGEESRCTIDLAASDAPVEPACGTLLTTLQQEVGDQAFVGN